MNRRMLAVFLSLSVVPLLASPVLADDLLPPPWRGQADTTFAQWGFGDPSPSPAPCYETNPYGGSYLTVTPCGAVGWLQLWGGRDGVWPLSGTIEAYIYNSPISNPYKDIWVQLTWSPSAPGGIPVVQDLISGQVGSVVGQTQLEATNETPLYDHWYHTTYLIHIEPNPYMENVKISGDINVDQLVIDTICAPEPGVVALLSVGAMAMIRRRKRS